MSDLLKREQPDRARSRNILCAFMISAGLAACATTEDVVSVPYKAAPAAAAPGAERIQVTVTARDVRAMNRGRISSKKNSYGMEMAAIRAKDDVADTVRLALSDELKARGFGLGAGGPSVNANVHVFYADFQTGLVTGKANGDVHLTVAVTDSRGADAYRNLFIGKSSNTVALAGGKNAAAAISDALRDALSKLFADPAFLAALR